MFKGFYNLASGMITHGKNLDVISNNMANVATAGFKADCFTGQTFDEVMWSRVGNKQKTYIDIGEISYATVPSQVYTDYTQGAWDDTGMPLDFGIEGEGFFAVRTADGIAYTRAGNFTLDEEGYLALPGFGRVLDINNEDILLVTDKIRADDYGRIYTEEGAFLGQLGVFEFQDLEALDKTPQGLFTGGGQAQLGTARVLNRMVERSNVGLVQQMTKMMTTQRAYQSAAQVTKMYDQVMNQATTELGRV